MKKGFYVIIFLAVCMIVPAVNAFYCETSQYVDIIEGPVIYNLTVSGGYVFTIPYDAYFLDECPVSNTITITESTTITFYYDISEADGPFVLEQNVYNFNVLGPEPTPNPNGYLDYNIMFADELSTTYQIITRNPSNNPILEFSQITTEPQTWNIFVMFYSVTSLVYTIPAGQTVTFYALSTTDLSTTTELTLTIKAPSNENIINQTSPEIQPNNTAYNPPPIPQVTPGSHDNPINSGKFKPSNNNFVTPFTEFVNNAKTITRLPTMTDPQVLKTDVLNGTGNITAPLYDTIDSFSNLLIFPALTASSNIQLLLQPLEEMLQYCDEVMIEIFKTVNNFFETIYPLRDFFYMLIPDFVWWIMAALLVFEIVVTIMTFVYGRGVTWYYLFGFGERDKK